MTPTHRILAGADNPKYAEERSSDRTKPWPLTPTWRTKLQAFLDEDSETGITLMAVLIAIICVTSVWIYILP